MTDKQGLNRALEGKFAFFVSETVAKRIFHKTLIFKRCLIDELPMENTTGVMALPMPKNSPYKKIIDIRYWIKNYIIINYNF